MACSSRLWLVCGSLGVLASGVFLEEAEQNFRPGLQGTTFWDCNGASCDAKVLKPFERKLFSYAPHYAPASPAEHGGSKYGEMLWLTGAASDDLTQFLKNDKCCGVGAGCGGCLLVRNPTAINSHWTAVVMKKSRCPPDSKGCEAGNLHMDFAVPGFEFINESTANVCGSFVRKETYLSQAEVGACMTGIGNDTAGTCCDALPNGTAEQQALRYGCKLFAAWGWTDGAPALEYTEVECPEAFALRISEAFGSGGVRSMEPPDYTIWLVVGLSMVLICVAIGLTNFFIDRREARKRYMEMEAKRRRRRAQQKEGTRASSSATGSDSSSDDLTSE